MQCIKGRPFGIFSASSVHVGVADSVTQHSTENDSAVGSAPEPYAVDSVDAVKVEKTIVSVELFHVEISFAVVKT